MSLKDYTKVKQNWNISIEMPYSSAGPLSNLQTHLQMYLERVLESLAASGKMHVVWLELGDICLAKSTLTMRWQPSRPYHPHSPQTLSLLFFSRLWEGKKITLVYFFHSFFTDRPSLSLLRITATHELPHPTHTSRLFPPAWRWQQLGFAFIVLLGKQCWGWKLQVVYTLTVPLFLDDWTLCELF